MAFTKDEEIAFRGYNEVQDLFVPGEDLKKFIREVSEKKKECQVTSVRLLKYRRLALKATKAFYNEILKVHKVLFYMDLSFLPKKIAYVKPINPFWLPIKKINYDGDIFEGSVIEHLIPEFKPMPTFRGIVLSYPYTEHTAISYAHEIMHTQLDSVPGSIVNFFDAEAMSIFIELVMSYYLNKDERLLDLEDKRRMCEMSVILDCIVQYLYDKEHGELDEEEYKKRYENLDVGNKSNIKRNIRTEILEDTKYLISNLKAFQLFNIFYYGDDKIRKEIFKGVQRVMDGELNLEEFLTIFDINADSVQDGKVLRKYFER